MKQQDYEILIEQLRAMCEGQRYMYTLLSNTSALLKQSLQVGPFQGLVACEMIEVGNGVCGTAVERRETILVRNVHEFAGHIACDSASNSEIVIPIIINDAVWGVLDIDSPLIARFDETDQKYLEEAARILTVAIKDIQS